MFGGLWQRRLPDRQCAIPVGRDGLHPLDDERRGHVHGDHPWHKDGFTWEAMRRLPLLRMASSESTLSRASREEMQLVEEIAAECKLLGAQLRRAIDAWLQPAIVSVFTPSRFSWRATAFRRSI